MEKEKYTVYYNDGVNCPADVYTADTLEECKEWIDEQLEGKTPVDEEHPCSECVMNSSRTFSYEVYEGDMIVEENGEAIFKNCCYSSDYYYTY